MSKGSPPFGFMPFFSSFKGKSGSSPKSGLPSASPEFQKAYELSKNAPIVPDIPRFTFTGNIEENLRSLTNRIRDLEDQLNLCTSLSKSKYLDSATIERLYQCQDRLECALEESFLIRGFIVPPDCRKLLHSQLLQKSIDVSNSIVERLHESHQKYRTSSIALDIFKHLHGGVLPDTDSVKEHQSNLEDATFKEQQCGNSFVVLFSPHYGEPVGRNSKTLYILTGNVVLDYVALDCKRHNFNLSAKNYEKKLSSIDSTSDEFHSIVEKFHAASYLEALTKLIMDAISPDGCPVAAPQIAPDSLQRAQSLLDEIFSDALRLNKFSSYINSAENELEIQKRRDSFQSKLDEANEDMQLAAVKLSEIYNL